jgi:hypothetical protein
MSTVPQSQKELPGSAFCFVRVLFFKLNGKLEKKGKVYITKKSELLPVISGDLIEWKRRQKINCNSSSEEQMTLRGPTKYPGCRILLPTN